MLFLVLSPSFVAACKPVITASTQRIFFTFSAFSLSRKTFFATEGRNICFNDNPNKEPIVHSYLAWTGTDQSRVHSVFSLSATSTSSDLVHLFISPPNLSCTELTWWVTARFKNKSTRRVALNVYSIKKKIISALISCLQTPACNFLKPRQMHKTSNSLISFKCLACAQPFSKWHNNYLPKAQHPVGHIISWTSPP